MCSHKSGQKYELKTRRVNMKMILIYNKQRRGKCFYGVSVPVHCRSYCIFSVHCIWPYFIYKCIHIFYIAQNIIYGDRQHSTTFHNVFEPTKLGVFCCLPCFFFPARSVVVVIFEMKNLSVALT